MILAVDVLQSSPWLRWRWCELPWRFRTILSCKLVSHLCNHSRPLLCPHAIRRLNVVQVIRIVTQLPPGVLHRPVAAGAQVCFRLPFTFSSSPLAALNIRSSPKSQKRAAGARMTLPCETCSADLHAHPRERPGVCDWSVGFSFFLLAVPFYFLFVPGIVLLSCHLFTTATHLSVTTRRTDQEGIGHASSIISKENSA